jgi:hypothetical protein
MNPPTGIHFTHPGVGTRTGLGRVGQLAGLAGLGWLGVGIFGAWEVTRDGSGERSSSPVPPTPNQSSHGCWPSRASGTMSP